jgi:hypothetical protein
VCPHDKGTRAPELSLVLRYPQPWNSAALKKRKPQVVRDNNVVDIIDLATLFPPLDLTSVGERDLGTQRDAHSEHDEVVQGSLREVNVFSPWAERGLHKSAW